MPVNRVRRVLLPPDESDPVVISDDRAVRSSEAGELLTKKNVRALLERRWQDLDKPLLGLRDRLLSSEPVAIVEGFGPKMFELVRKVPPASERSHQVTYLVPEPATAESIRSSLANRGIDFDPLLYAFLVAFDALRDQPAPDAGGFVPHQQWSTIVKLSSHCREDTLDAARREGWSENYVIYNAVSGDNLVYSPSGQIGWYISAESRYEPCWATFREFLYFYTEFQDRFRPLDSYQTPRLAYDGTIGLGRGESTGPKHVRAKPVDLARGVNRQIHREFSDIGELLGFSPDQKDSADLLEEKFSAELKANPAAAIQRRTLVENALSQFREILVPEQLPKFDAEMRARAERAALSVTRNNLTAIGLAALVYSSAHNGAFPSDIGTLVSETLEPKTFLAGNSTAKLPPDLEKQEMRRQAEWVTENTDFVWLAAGRTKAELPDTFVVAYVKPAARQKNFLLAMGLVQTLDSNHAERVEAELKAGKNPPPSLVQNL